MHSIKGNKKVAILGDMLELGDYEKQMHEKVGEEVVKNKVDILITTIFSYDEKLKCSNYNGSLLETI